MSQWCFASLKANQWLVLGEAASQQVFKVNPKCPKELQAFLTNEDHIQHSTAHIIHLNSLDTVRRNILINPHESSSQQYKNFTICCKQNF